MKTGRLHPDSYLASLRTLVIAEYVPVEVAEAKALAQGEGFSHYHYAMADQLRRDLISYRAETSTK